MEVVPNDFGKFITPSIVAYSSAGCLIGDLARNQAAQNPKNTIFDSKRLMGRRFDEPEVQIDIENWPFNVKNENGRPVIQVELDGRPKMLSPEDVASMVLFKMKLTAESYLGKTVSDAVITVPAFFNDQQRYLTKVAASLAGLNVLRIINEPTAAAMSYMFDHSGILNMLIFSAGGGTVDVSLVILEDGVYEVKATAGVSHLGGGDFDKRLMDHCISKFKEAYHQDPSGDSRALVRLRSACEHAKCCLSSSTSTIIEINDFFRGHDLLLAVTRTDFENLCNDLFRKMISPIEKVLMDSVMRKDKIDEVVLVGGSTRIPRIQQILTEFFNGKSLNTKINPDEAVAYGAAIQASILIGKSSGRIGEMLLLDVASITLGVETEGGIMKPIILRNTTIPTKKSAIFTTVTDNQSCILVKIYEGESTIANSNNLLGWFELDNIPPAPKEVLQIEITFDIDANSIITVHAVEKSTGRRANYTVASVKTLPPDTRGKSVKYVNIE